MSYAITFPYYFNADETNISVTWNHPELGAIPFLASPNDVMPYGREIYAAAVAGEYGQVRSYAETHWLSTVDGNTWQGRTYKAGSVMVSPAGVQPPKSSKIQPA